MSANQIASLLLGLGVGGTVGALAALALSGGKLVDALKDFGTKFRSYTAAQTTSALEELKTSFAVVEEQAGKLLEVVLRARRALRWK